MEMVFSYSVSDAIKYHVNYSRSFLSRRSVDDAFSAVFSVATGVGGYWWPICDRAILMDVAFRQFSCNPPISASVADAITFLIMLHSTFTGSFGGGHLLYRCVEFWS